MTDRNDGIFYAYASKKHALTMVAGVLPMATLMIWTLVINSVDPFGLRLVFAAIFGAFALILVGPLHRVLVRGPMITVSAQGFQWRGWSAQTIPWSAVERWKTTRYLGTRYVTIWLRNPQDHPSTTATRWAQWANGWMKQGHISIPEGGLISSHEDVAAAFARFAPLPPLPDDPRLARRLKLRRDRRNQKGSS